jgi:hypothetical protein
MEWMKRCPQCDFLYLDSDQVCDLDGALLETVGAGNPPKIEARQNPVRQSWKTFAMLVVPGVIFGAVLFVVYNWVARQRATLVTREVPELATYQPSPKPESSPVETPTPTPEPSKSPLARPSPTKAPTPARLSSKPISTESEKEPKQGMIIRLSDGGTIAADEAWRTKDGIWYRRKGVVTLLKREQVKAIEKVR